MPAILIKFFTWVGHLVLGNLIERLTGYISKKVAERKARLAIEQAAKDSVKKLNAATTAKEIDDASDDSLNGL
jgi:hypothetical protein